MAGIVLESIGVYGRASNCLRFLRVSQRPFVRCPLWATLHHRCRSYSSSDGSDDQKGKDQLHQMKTIQLGDGQLAKNSDGSKVTAAPPPPDPKDTPGEKRTELPYEVRPEIPMEAQPNRIQPTPLEVKPTNPQPIICNSDSEVFGDAAAKDVDPNIESEPKSYCTSSNELPPPPVINLMDEQTPSPSPTTTELDKSMDSPFISIECDLNYPSRTVHEFVDARYQAPSVVKSEPTSQGSSSNGPKSENSQGQIESKDSHLTKKYELKTIKLDPYGSCTKSGLDINPQPLFMREASGDSRPPLTLEDDSRPVSKEPGSIGTLDLKVMPKERKVDFPSSHSADNSERSSCPETNAVGSGWSQGSSFHFPREGKIAGKDQQVKPANYSSAKDEYGTRYDQIYGRDQDKKATSTADRTSENVVDNEVINTWVDKFKRLYMAENAAFGLNNENDKQNSGSKEKKDRNRLQTMVMKDNKWVFGNQDTADKSTGPGDTLPLKIRAKQEASGNIKDENLLKTMVLKDNKWVFEKKDTSKKVSSSYDPNFFKTSRTSHEGDVPSLDTEPNHEAFSNKKDAQRLQNMVKKDNKWVFKDSAEPGSSQKNTSPGATLATTESFKDEQNRKTLHSEPKDQNDEKSPTSMIKKNNVWVLRNKESAKTIPPSSEAPFTDKSNPGGTLPLKIVGKHEAPAELKESKKDLPASNKNAQIDASKPIKVILGQSPAAEKSKAGSTESSLDFLAIAQGKSSSKTTEEIIAMFKEDNSDNFEKMEDDEIFDGMTMAEFTKDSQADVLDSFNTEDAAPNKEAKLDQARADKEADEYFSKMLDFEESITAHEDDKPEQKDPFISSSDRMENFNLAEKVSSFIKASNDSDSSEIDQKSMSSNVEVDSMLKDNEPKDTSQTETTSLLPNDLYDPLANEVSGPMPTETAGVEESEDESPELKTKKEETTVPTPQAREETKKKVTERPPTEKKPVRKEKPQLEQGELSMKLLDRESAEPPTSAAKTSPSPAKMPPPAEKSLPVEKIPAIGAESRTSGEKSLIRRLFDKILGGRGKNDGKRQMSTYTAKRQLSTSLTFALSPSGSPNLAKNSRQESLARTLVTMGSVSEFHEEDQEVKPAKVLLQKPDMLQTELDLFAKKSKDLTEIKGGSPSCVSPKKTPLELLREKKNSKKIKILGGSEECAKKLKGPKELTKKTDDDCERDNFSISQLLGQLRVSFSWSFYWGD